MPEFTKPYGYEKDGLPGLDFNREVVEPGLNEDFPDGVVGIRVDDNFWCVAKLPLEEYRNKPLPEIVAELWPDYVEQATYTPDHNTHEREVFVIKQQLTAEEERSGYYRSLADNLTEEVKRLRLDRPDISPRSPARLKLEHNYFVRQYEHLLIAMAHEAEPRKDLPGICSICGLYKTDRVHQKNWIDKHKQGYKPAMHFEHLVDSGEEEE